MENAYIVHSSHRRGKTPVSEHVDTLRRKPGRKPRCRQCRNKVLAVSARGLCVACGGLNVLRNIKAMRDQEGPEFDRWQAGMLKAAGVDNNDSLGTTTKSSDRSI